MNPVSEDPGTVQQFDSAPRRHFFFSLVQLVTQFRFDSALWMIQHFVRTLCELFQTPQRTATL